MRIFHGCHKYIPGARHGVITVSEIKPYLVNSRKSPAILVKEPALLVWAQLCNAALRRIRCCPADSGR